MKPETLKILSQRLKDCSNYVLYQFVKAVAIELERRGAKHVDSSKLNGFWISKDCNPNPES